jgi:exopolysaccharide biosynthesis polyprenyl glycosylphosphotransferase
LFDLGLMILAFMVSAVIAMHQTHRVTVTDFFEMRIKIQNFAIFALLVLAWHVIFRVCRLYDSKRLTERHGEMWDVVKATTLCGLLVAIGSVAFHITLATPLFLGVFWVVTTSLTMASRLALRVALAYIRKHGHNLRNVIIVGTNTRALEFANKVLFQPELGYRIAGFVDQDWHGLERFRKTGYTLSCDFERFPEFLREAVVDEVAISLPFRSLHDQASRIAAVCEEQGVTVRVLSQIFDRKIPRSSNEEPEGSPLITHSANALDGWPKVVKRVLDCVISTISLIIVLPILLLAAILIKVTSPGPIFFVQKRLGLNKRLFNVYKFRTMVLNAEKRIRELEHLNEVSGPVFKIKNDPRITPVGRFLRKTSIDELPQLFNVLIGDMSLVGPRPLPVRDYEGFNKDWQRRRFSVKPGITCFWQVGGRSSIAFEQWMELDLEYIDKWSLWLDFQILLRTIPAVFKGLGAT